MKLIYLLCFITLTMSIAKANECNTWFETANLKPGGECLFKCADESTNAKNFHCPDL